VALRRVLADSVVGGRAYAEGPRAHHLARVARLEVGERVEVSDTSQAWTATVEGVSGEEVVFLLGDPVDQQDRGPSIELHLAVIKFPRFELAVEKATELGVETIVPVAAERSDGGLVRAAVKRSQRWRRVAEEAAQQSRRLAAPEIAEPISFSEALERPADRRLLLDFEGEALEPAPENQRTTLLIGPEGGWTDSERTEAAEAGAVGVRLGATVLRAETAAIAAVAIARAG